MNAAVQTQEAIHDFDFLRGSWQVHNRRLLKRLQHSNEWESFDAMTPENFKVLDGLGNIDELHTEDGAIGMSLRFFNRETEQWSIYWVSHRDGILQPPVVGGFSAGVGIFEGADVWEGKPIRVRFTWSDITPRSARWQQAFSPDDGHTWEVNWVMEFTRIEDAKIFSEGTGLAGHIGDMPLQKPFWQEKYLK
ncbi:MAG: hypothetical protein ABI690_15195 [Chloroflexota bacterium]